MTHAATTAGVSTRRLTWTSLLFFASGAVALIQEVAWSQVLARTLGHGTAAVALVAAVFLTGLAIGAGVGARVEGRWTRPLRFYGQLEIGIGVLSAVLALALPRLPRVTATLGPVVVETGAAGLLFRALVAAVCLLPVTLLMGATLPAIVSSVSVRATEIGRVAGRFAGVNAAGGALGALAAVFVLLPSLGTGRTLMTAALSSSAVGAIALALGRGDRPRPSHRTSAAGSRSGPRLERTFFPMILLTAGVASMSAQVGWTRFLSWMLGPSVYAFGLVLAVVVGGIGAGSLLIARRAGRTSTPERLFGRLELTLGLAVVGTVWAAPLVPSLVARLAAATQGRPGWLQAGEFVLVAALIGVPTVLIGTAFPAACRLLAGIRRPAQAVGRTSALLTVGNVAGAILGGLVLSDHIGARGMLLGAALLFTATGLAVAWRAPGAGARAGNALAAAATVGAVLVAPAWTPDLMASGPALNGPTYLNAARISGRSLTQTLATRGSIVFAAEGADALVTVRRLPGNEASLQINGKTEASTSGDLRAQILAAQVPLLHVEAPRQVLVIGLASGVTAGSLLSRTGESLTVVEVSPTSVLAARCGAFDLAAGRPLEDPRTRLVVADARALLLHDPATYDLIASQPSNPWIPGVAALYTEEFFRLARARLRPEGVFGQWVQAYGIRVEDFAGILRTFAAVFPHCALYEESVGGGDYFLVGSDSPLAREASTLLRRITPAARDELARAGLDGPFALLGHRVLDDSGVRAFAGSGALLTDDRLRLAYTTPLTIWLESARGLAERLEQHRTSAAASLSMAELTPTTRQLLQAELARHEASRRHDWQFLELLDVDTDDDLAHPDVLEAIALARSGRFRPAYTLLAAVAAERPGSAAVQVIAGDLAARLAEPAIAEIHYAAALASRPGSSAARLGLALALLSTDPGRAGDLLASVVQDDPDSVVALVALGGLLTRQGRSADAVPLLRRATTLAPEHAAGWSNLGVALRRTGQSTEAESAYRRALQRQPSNAPAWYNLGILLREGGREPEAVDAFQRGLLVAPDDCDLHRALAGSNLPARGTPPPPICDEVTPDPVAGADRAEPRSPRAPDPPDRSP